jgi:primosomal replication protein N
MHEENEICLTGIISKIYPAVVTPAGVSVARLVLEHNSEQVEGGIKRRVKCKIYCVYVAGKILAEWLNCRISVVGFLSINSQKEIVLHITKIKNLD